MGHTNLDGSDGFRTPPFHDHPAAEGGSHRYGDFGVILGGLSPRGRARVEDVPGYCELSIPEGERLQPHIPWTTPDATLVSKKGYPSEVKVRASQLKDCEMLQRAGLGMTNHLDWFISTIWRVLDQAQLAEETKAELDGLLTSSLVSVNQTAHVFARLLASNATTRREGILDSSVLDRASELVLRGQPIGGADLMGGRCAEFMQRAAEET